MRLVILLASFVLCGHGHCALTIEEYKKNHDDTSAGAYVEGIGVGLAEANGMLELKRQKPLFCRPGNLALNRDNYRAILDQELQQQYVRQLQSPTVETVLLYGLMRAFPCP